MRTIARCLVAAAAFTCLGAMGSTDPDWASFGKGDPSLDVPASLDNAPTVTIYSALRHLAIRAFDTSGDETIALTWDDSKQEFALWLDGKRVADLVTGTDEWNRPTFAGGFTATTSSAAATVNGFADLTSDGAIMIDITRPGHADSRFIADKHGLVAAGGQCECSATHVTLVCEKKHCDQNPPPACSLSGTVSCGWKTAVIVSD
jgi:hypothetical protein